MIYGIVYWGVYMCVNINSKFIWAKSLNPVGTGDSPVSVTTVKTQDVKGNSVKVIICYKRWFDWLLRRGSVIH